MPASDAILLGRLVVERGLAGHDVVAGTLKQIGIEGDADALAAGLSAEVAEEQREQIRQLAGVAKEAEARALIGDPRPFGAIALELGALTPEALQEAISSQAALRSRGIVKRLGALLVARGDLPPAQVRDVLKAQGQVIFGCGDCGSRFNVLGAGGVRPNCPLCHTATAPTQPGDAVEVEGTMVAAPGAPRRGTPPKIRSRTRQFRERVKKKSAFAGYEIEHEIARGGMGIVYKARKPGEADSAVALKVLLAGEGASQEMIDRLYVEAEAAAKLRHPNIVTVHDVGVFDQSHFISMDFISGEALDSTLRRQGHLSPKRAAQVALALAEALEYAHAQGIVHRDLKPANVMIDDDGHPVLTDFGLAKDLVADKGLTTASAVLGTPDYMSPEQARGSSRTIDGRSDVFGLGALLYHMLDGHPPFTARTPMKTMDNVLRFDPPPPSRDNPAVPRELDAIVRKALEKSPADRYQDAGELARDLQRWLEGGTVTAEAPSAWGDGWRRLRRDRRLQQLIGVALAAGVLGSVVTLVATHDGGRGRTRTTSGETSQNGGKASAGETRLETLQKLIRSRMGDAHKAEAQARTAARDDFKARRSALHAAYQLWHQLGQLLDEDAVAREAVASDPKLNEARQVTTRKLALQRNLSSVHVDEAESRGAEDESAQAAYDAALTDLEKAIDLDAENGRAFSLRAWLRALRLWAETPERKIPSGEVNHIEFDCRKALGADPADGRALAARALLYANLGRYDEALLACGGAARAPADRRKAAYARGYTLFQRSASDGAARSASLEEAARAFEEARRVAREAHDAVMAGRAAVSLAKVLDQLGRQAEALRVLSQYLQPLGKDLAGVWPGEALFIRGWVFEEGPDEVASTAKAMQDYERVPPSHPRYQAARERAAALKHGKKRGK
ncbi:MAG: serine/threonine-protein kinase [Planctomycetota bacterium]|jgi:tetratricopeptide (TPR) repeat protein